MNVSIQTKLKKQQLINAILFMDSSIDVNGKTSESLEQTIESLIGAQEMNDADQRYM